MSTGARTETSGPSAAGVARGGGSTADPDAAGRLLGRLSVLPALLVMAWLLVGLPLPVWLYGLLSVLSFTLSLANPRPRYIACAFPLFIGAGGSARFHRSCRAAKYASMAGAWITSSRAACPAALPNVCRMPRGTRTKPSGPTVSS